MFRLYFANTHVEARHAIGSTVVAGTIYEWFGYRGNDMSPTAASAALNQHCPFLNSTCVKQGKTGVCSIEPATSHEHVAICPVRMYFDGHHFLREIASESFADLNVALAADGLPVLLPAKQAKQAAAASGVNQVGIFGAKPWSGEISLPPAVPGAGRYKVDFTAVVVSPTGDLLRFTPVEVQSIDTTNKTTASMTGLKNGRQIVQSGVGLNWENVNKRILPQLIVKGLMLQAEGLCSSGLYFVTPEPVYKRITLRLGGPTRLRQIPRQPGSLTFIRYDYDFSAPLTDGTPVPLKRLPPITVSTSDLSLAFITPENLPQSSAYEASILAKL